MRKSLSLQLPTPIHGFVQDRFAIVRETFIANFAQRGEVGAALCVYLDGRPVVDLWGGYADLERSRVWQTDTIVCMMSVSKAMVSLCAHMLIDRGLLELDAPVSHYWPEFGQSGKQTISVDCLISHLAAIVFPDDVPENAMPNWSAMTFGLAAQTPAWEPDTRGAYHSSTFGHLVGELVERVSGKPFAGFFSEEVATPLGADFFFSVPTKDTHRVADFLTNPETESVQQITKTTGSALSRAWRPLPRINDVFNSSMWRTSIMPSANGHGNARAVARILAAAIGEVDGKYLLSAGAVDVLREERWFEDCGLTGRHFRFGRGFALHNPRYHPMGRNSRAFGHAGMGGSYTFADPEAGLSFGYSMNYPASGDKLGDRPRALVDALYSCI